MKTDRTPNYTRWITIDGEHRSLVNWAEAYGISKQTLWDRLDQGWDEEEAVTRPVRRYRKKGEPSG